MKVTLIIFCIFFFLQKNKNKIDEADKEMNESVASRGLSVGENTEKPSEVLKALEKGLSTVADIVTEGFDV